MFPPFDLVDVLISHHRETDSWFVDSIARSASIKEGDQYSGNYYATGQFSTKLQAIEQAVTFGEDIVRAGEAITVVILLEGNEHLIVDRSGLTQGAFYRE